MYGRKIITVCLLASIYAYFYIYKKRNFLDYGNHHLTEQINGQVSIFNYLTDFM